MELTWIEEFKKYLLIEKQYSDETLKAYSEDLQHFVDLLTKLEALNLSRKLVVMMFMHI